MKTLSAAALEEGLKEIPTWLRKGEVLEKTFDFPDFGIAIAFVTKVAWAAEKVDHHPDIDIRWNKVRISLTTHDAGGLTDLDLGLAAKCDTLAGQVVRVREPYAA
jgi:4a-hydroxytetrahydrobiopterin dehydratase